MWVVDRLGSATRDGNLHRGQSNSHRRACFRLIFLPPKSHVHVSIFQSFGTPLEDACRRDLTINALFYNLHSQQIEDQTGLGLQDLGLVPGFEPRIRTPLQPFETFHDDPLRVVRAVRFAARFGRAFKLDEELVETIGREEIRVVFFFCCLVECRLTGLVIQAALRDPKKISRERVGVELEKMLLGSSNSFAFRHCIFLRR